MELSRHLQRLTALIDKAESLNHDFELQGHWGKYLCILSAGFLETALRELYADRARRCASPDVSSFVARVLERFQNPKADRFLEVARMFDRNWAENLEAFLEEDDGHRKNAVDSIMSNRHLIAHGRSATITVARVREYLQASVEVVEYVELLCA
jgi:hypothetical protein